MLPAFAKLVSPLPPGRRGNLIAGGAVIFLIFWPCSPALAHDFGNAGGNYENFLAGCAAVLYELPVLVALASAGILVSLWDRNGLPRVWLHFALGVTAGFALALTGWPDPLSAAYGPAIALGLLAAAAIRPETWLMRVIMFLAGLFPAAAILGGHEAGSVPFAAYAGMFVTLNAGLSIAAAIVSLALGRLAYSWVPIAFRALASWLVAIAVMSFAFIVRSAG